MRLICIISAVHSRKKSPLSKHQIATIFNVLRILKNINPGDSYYEAYLAHLKRNGESLYDIYMLLWEIGSTKAPRRILEVGTRTGISLCQLLSSYLDPTAVDRIVCVDPMDDGFLSPNLVRKNLRHLFLPAEKVEFIQEKSDSALSRLIDEGALFDQILIDGDHTKAVARQDLESAHKLCDKGGTICFDDVSPAPGECALIDVWQDFETNHEREYEFNVNMVGKGVAWAVKK